MRNFLTIPCLFIAPLLLAGCGEERQEIACGDLEKRILEFSKTLQEDLMKLGRAKGSGDTKTVCQTSSSVLSTYRPMFKAASSCQSVSTAVSLNQLIRKMDEMRQEAKC